MINTLLFIAVGILAGVLSGLFGIGGGIVIIPALVFFCGFSQLKAQGTSLAILLPPTGILAFLTYYKRGEVNLKAGILICIFAVLGSLLGAKLAGVIPANILKRAFGILMLAISLKFIFGK